jgi:hypothetical protein
MTNVSLALGVKSMSDKDYYANKYEGDLAELKLQMLELDGRLNALSEKGKRDRWTQRVLVLQLAIGLTVLIFLLYLLLAPYLRESSPALPYFLKVVSSFLAVLIGYWTYQNHVKLRLYLGKRARISEVMMKVTTIKDGAIRLLEDPSSLPKK